MDASKTQHSPDLSSKSQNLLRYHLIKLRRADAIRDMRYTHLLRLPAGVASGTAPQSDYQSNWPASQNNNFGRFLQFELWLQAVFQGCYFFGWPLCWLWGYFWLQYIINAFSMLVQLLAQFPLWRPMRFPSYTLDRRSGFVFVPPFISNENHCRVPLRPVY